MIAQNDAGRGRFSVEIELANYKDLNRVDDGRLSPQEVRRARVRGVVDTGATRLVIPQKLADHLGLDQVGEVSVRYADGRQETRPLVGGIYLTYAGRSSVFNAIVEPQREPALVGAIVLEDLDLIADCSRQTLAPRDPKQIISEVE